ncbi:MAG: Rpp14/Pop5 family protein [Candidatus Thorarchaeota archaeon]
MRTYRKRHVLVMVHTDGTQITEKKIGNAIIQSILSLYGELTVAMSRFFIDSYDESTGVCIIQCNSSVVDNVLTAMSALSEINGCEVSLDPKRTSGTIKGLLRRSPRR